MSDSVKSNEPTFEDPYIKIANKAISKLGWRSRLSDTEDKKAGVYTNRTAAGEPVGTFDEVLTVMKALGWLELPTKEIPKAHTAEYQMRYVLGLLPTVTLETALRYLKMDISPAEAISLWNANIDDETLLSVTDTMRQAKCLGMDNIEEAMRFLSPFGVTKTDILAVDHWYTSSYTDYPTKPECYWIDDVAKLLTEKKEDLTGEDIVGWMTVFVWFEAQFGMFSKNTNGVDDLIVADVLNTYDMGWKNAYDFLEGARELGHKPTSKEYVGWLKDAAKVYPKVGMTGINQMLELIAIGGVDYVVSAIEQGIEAETMLFVYRGIALNAKR